MRQREWAEAKKELHEERENVRRLTMERENDMKQVEETRKELANALHALAAAEARASIAEVSNLMIYLSSYTCIYLFFLWVLTFIASSGSKLLYTQPVDLLLIS